MNASLIRSRAGAYQAAWARRYGVTPTLHATVLGLAVAMAETREGDEWPGGDDDSNNWSDDTLRMLNAGELAAVRAAGIRPIVGHRARAREAQDAIVAAGLPMPKGEIACLDSPRSGAYFVWRASFDSPVDGADFFIRLLTGKKDGSFRAAKSVLERDSGTEQELATALYAAGRFSGTHAPSERVPLPDGSTVSGGQMNIDEYADRLRQLTPGIRDALLATAAFPPPPLLPGAGARK